MSLLGALDTKTGMQVLKALQDVSIKNNKTVIIVTHNERFAKIANRVIKLKNGKIEAIIENKNPISANKVEE